MRNVVSTMIAMALLLTFQAGMARADYYSSINVQGSVTVAGGGSPGTVGFNQNIAVPTNEDFFLSLDSSNVAGQTVFASQADNPIMDAVSGLTVIGNGQVTVPGTPFSGDSNLQVTVTGSGPSTYTLSVDLDDGAPTTAPVPVSFSFTDNGSNVVAPLDTSGMISSAGTLAPGSVVLMIDTNAATAGVGSWTLNLTVSPSVAPLPPAALLLATGLIPLAWARRKKRLGK